MIRPPHHWLASTAALAVFGFLLRRILRTRTPRPELPGTDEFDFIIVGGGLCRPFTFFSAYPALGRHCWVRPRRSSLRARRSARPPYRSWPKVCLFAHVDSVHLVQRKGPV